MDWVKKPVHKSLLGELIGMGSEIFFLHRVKLHNPYKIWFFSIAMHWGIYLLLAWVFLLVVEAVFKLRIDLLAQLINLIGIAAFVLGTFGSLMLAVKRATVSGLKIYSSPVDYFNLFFLFAIFATGLFS
jgi:nitrate reductase gamma subunit